MKKGLLVLVVMLLVNVRVNGQTNLVLNPGFEIIDSCNVPMAGINGNLLYWDTPSWGSPDIYNVCSLNHNTQVPSNFIGYQYPHSGNGYAGEVMYYNMTPREYCQGQLVSDLLSGRTYSVSFYVSLANVSDLGIHNFGMYFSPTHIFDSIITYLNLIPQVNDTSLMIDTLNWKKISGTFVANGGERYLIIGNFFSDYTTDSSAVPINDTLRQGAYYYIDDVDVHCCDCNGGVCDTTSGAGVNEFKGEELQIMPNPATNELRIRNYELGIKQVRVYDVLGNLIRNYELGIRNKEATIDISNYANGMYFVEIKTEKGVVRKKVVKE
jgi:hypothetical protein